MNAKDINDIISQLLHGAIIGLLIYVVGSLLVFALFLWLGPRFMKWMMGRFDV